MNDEKLSAVAFANAPVTKGKILVVDDDQTFRMMTRAVLKKNGYETVEASNGLEGLHLLRQEQPDLVLCDINMPILTGIEFVEEAATEYPSLPMIVVSGTDKMSIVAKALRFGIKDFITKPITDPSSLVAAVSDTLEQTSDQAVESRDFASQWFQIGDDGEIPEEQELHWHLAHLQQHPQMARELLTALVPEPSTSQGSWSCNFRLLQSLDEKPVVFDYIWLINGQFVFYIVNTGSGSDESAATTLLIRALFNDYIRNRNGELDNLRNLVSLIEKGIQCSDYADSIDALFGVADLANHTISILSTGLEAKWVSASSSTHIEPTSALGEGLNKIRRLDHYNLEVEPIEAEHNLLSISSLTATNVDLKLRFKD
jgi:CheY-like chemotaxis protein